MRLAATVLALFLAAGCSDGRSGPPTSPSGPISSSAQAGGGEGGSAGMGGMPGSGGDPAGGMGGMGGEGGTAVPMVVPDFQLADVNANSPRFGQAVSPRDYLMRVSGWYFGHAT